MRPKLGLAAAFVVVFAFSSTSAHASPWTRELGQAYLKVGEGFFVGNGFIDANGVLQEGASYFGASSFAYFEVGLPARFQVMGYLPYTIALNTFDDGWQYMRGGTGDAMVGLQWSPPIDLGFPVALKTDLKIPLYDVAYFRSFGALASKFASLGDGQVDATVWLSAGGAIPDTPLYVFAEAGHRIRTNIYTGDGDLLERDFADAFVVSSQIGCRVFASMIIAASTNLVMPYEDDGLSRAYLGLGLSAFYELGAGFALEASFDPIVWAKNSSTGFGTSLGVSVQL